MFKKIFLVHLIYVSLQIFINSEDGTLKDQHRSEKIIIIIVLVSHNFVYKTKMCPSLLALKRESREVGEGHEESVSDLRKKCIWQKLVSVQNGNETIIRLKAHHVRSRFPTVPSLCSRINLINNNYKNKRGNSALIL